MTSPVRQAADVLSDAELNDALDLWYAARWPVPSGRQQWTPPQHGGRSVLLHLTERRAQVLEGVCRGWTDGHIAHDLGVTIWTVKKHVGYLLAHAHAESRQALVAAVYSGAVHVTVPAPAPWERKAS